jgi:hypothetical protein
MKNAMKRFQELNEAANNTVAGDMRTRPGREMLRSQARAALPEAEAALVAAFKKVGFPVFVTGPAASVKTFVGEAGELSDVVVVDYKTTTRPIAFSVMSAMGPRRREFTPSVFAVMIQGIRETAQRIGLSSIPDLPFLGNTYFANDKDVHEMVENYVASVLGADFIAGLLEFDALAQVKALGADGPVIPVLVLGVPLQAQAAVGRALFQGKFVATALGDTVTQDDAVKAFTEIKNAKKNTKKNAEK